MNILLVEDEDATRRGIALFLKSSGHHVDEATDGTAALELLERHAFDLVLSDVKMSPMDGLALLRRIQQRAPSPPVIMMTAFAGIEDAIQAVRHGAEDYLTKPLNLDELAVKIKRIGQKVDLIRENLQLKGKLKRAAFHQMIGTSPALREIHMTLERLTRDPDVSVMIYGESGTGKELVARTIHDMSARSAAPFVAVNCAAFPENLLESELFGYRRGAFTGAFHDKKGVLVEAHRGTLFLDEVSEMSPAMQSRLLRVLQERMVQPLGETRPFPVDVRVAGASNRDLEGMIAQGTFREDLFYRLNVVALHLPPLRRRPEDIPILIQHFIEKYLGRRKKRLLFSQSALDACMDYSWPGNVRELENTVRNLLVTSDAEVVGPEHLSFRSASSGAQRVAQTGGWIQGMDYKQALDAVVARFEKAYLSHHLQRCDGNISKTAQEIGLSRAAVHRKINQYGIDKDGPGGADHETDFKS